MNWRPGTKSDASFFSSSVAANHRYTQMQLQPPTHAHSRYVLVMIFMMWQLHGYNTYRGSLQLKLIFMRISCFARCPLSLENGMNGLRSCNIVRKLADRIPHTEQTGTFSHQGMYLLPFLLQSWKHILSSLPTIVALEGHVPQSFSEICC